MQAVYGGAEDGVGSWVAADKATILRVQFPVSG